MAGLRLRTLPDVSMTYEEPDLVLDTVDRVPRSWFAPAPGGRDDVPQILASLTALRLRPCDRVLDVGTGSGWAAALLCSALGDDRVTTVAADRRAAARAEAALNARGLAPRVAVADELPHRTGPLFDHIHSAVPVRRVPPGWLGLVRPWGSIVVPFRTYYTPQARLAVLTSWNNGEAAGRLTDQPSAVAADAPQEPQPVAGDVSEQLVPRLLLHGDPCDDLEFVLGLVLPGVRAHREPAGSGIALRWSSTADDSCAATTLPPDPAADMMRKVRQSGPRHLFEEVKDALLWWHANGRPRPSRFGITVATEGQRLWLDDPAEPLPLD